MTDPAFNDLAPIFRAANPWRGRCDVCGAGFRIEWSGANPRPDGDHCPVCIREVRNPGRVFYARDEGSDAPT